MSPQVPPGGYTAFVPDGDSRRDTAVLLIGTAREYQMDDARVVRAVAGGFYISDELAELLYDEDEQEPEVSGNPETKAPAEAPKASRKRSSSKKKASGNRAAKNSTAEQE